MSLNNPVDPIHINNTGRIVFNQEAAARLKHKPTYMKVIIDGEMIRLIPADEPSKQSLEMRYPEGDGPYTLEATRFFKPLGFERGKGMPSYGIPVVKPYGDGFEFPSPFRRN
jgi:hypothetical protein